MNLGHAIQDAVSRYLDERISAEELREWLVEHAQAIGDSHDADARLVYGRAWVLLSERDHGHRDDASVREELRTALGQVSTRYSA